MANSRLSIAVLAILIAVVSAPVRVVEAAEPPVYSLDFTGFPGGDVLKWLGTKGFVPKQDANNSRKVVYRVEGNDLRLEAKTQAQALLLNETHILDYSRIRIEWGVDAFPPEASYENGVRSESVMIYVFFGKERISSGSFIIPDSPYFLGLFLCESGKTNEAFTGRFYQAGGRYICLDRPPLGELVTTEYPIAQAFTRIFGKDHAPDISGLGISIDTSNAKGKGTGRAFVRKIELLR